MIRRVLSDSDSIVLHTFPHFVDLLSTQWTYHQTVVAVIVVHKHTEGINRFFHVLFIYFQFYF